MERVGLSQDREGEGTGGDGPKSDRNGGSRN